MPIWGWIVVAVVAALAVGVALWAAAKRQRTARLRRTFGPEYDRSVETTGSRQEAEAELSGRVRRRRELEIRPLTAGEAERYAQQWRQVQAGFVDDPRRALASADTLVYTVMADRGYPMEEFEQRAADVSVDHPGVVENYRAAHAIAEASERGDASTEDMRQGMQHYRALFGELLETDRDEPLARDPANQEQTTEGRMVS